MSLEMTATDHKKMRDLNRNRLLNFIRLNAPISRPPLGELSGLSAASRCDQKQHQLHRLCFLARQEKPERTLSPALSPSPMSPYFRLPGA
jgi:hypothetical protein